MPLNGRCHCGKVTIEVPRAPEWAASCNCSICRKRGHLTAYYKRSEISVDGETAGYETGDRLISFRHCPTCACAINWEAIPDALDRDDLPEDVRALLRDRTGINVRLLDGFEMHDGRCLVAGEQLEVRFMDNSD